VDWAQLDLPTRAAFVATVIAVIAVVVPIFSVASSVVAVTYASVALTRARRRGEPNAVARWCLVAAVALVVVLVVGNLVYGALA
jgi:uncharacterized membrane protein YidH (DUF202 family)